MNLKKDLKSKNGQSALEYAIIFAIIVSVIVGSGFLTRVKDIFSNHFTAMEGRIVGG